MGIAKSLVERQHDMLRRRDLGGVPDLYTISGYFSMGGVRVSPPDLPAIMHAYFSAFPDADNEVTDWIETPTGIAVEQVITATHAGPWMTAFGELAPTGRTVRWQAVEFVRIDEERIASWNSYFDQLAVLITLGVESVGPASRESINTRDAGGPP